ncbi:MAG: hypothetical protein WCA20_02515 [Candidatus Sulfotelmatobacter sp.]
MTRIGPEIVDFGPADRSVAIDALVREQPDEEEEEEEEEQNEDEDDRNSDGYSE